MIDPPDAIIRAYSVFNGHGMCCRRWPRRTPKLQKRQEGFSEARNRLRSEIVVAPIRASDLSATISGYLGSSNDEFDAAMGNFALAYAERDHAALKAAVRKGKITVCQESSPS
jgi:hypothetical protein